MRNSRRWFLRAMSSAVACELGGLMLPLGALTRAPGVPAFSYLDTIPITQTYLMSTFVDATARALFYTSADGLTWTQLDCPYISPAGSFVRDPSILKRDGSYWLAHTNVVNAATACTGFTVAKSDLTSWEAVTVVDMTAIVGVNRVWAPEWFVDPSDDSVHVFVACSTDSGSHFTIYETHPTNTEMTAWSDPVAITGVGLPTVMIDPFVVKREETYHLWYKGDNATNLISYASSSSLLSDYTVSQSGDWAGWGNNLEGHALLSLGGSSWRIYFDKYAGASQGMYYSESTDNWATWSAKALTTPSTLRHGTVITA